jgi:hypothetical protein
LEHEVVEIEHFAQLRGEAVPPEQIRDTHRAPRHFVLIRRPDAAAGGADCIQTARALTRLIQNDVRWQDQRAVR